MVLSRTSRAPIALIVALLSSQATAASILDYCLAHRNQCAISVHHVTDGWQRHLNADRLQATGSTFKVLSLIVYAQAVVDGRLDPEQLVTKEEWARFSTGLDGGSLADAWNRLGRPDEVTVDQMMGAMIQESDNAAPDWLLDKLGRKYFGRVLKRFLAGYHDLPESINGTFVTWFGNPEDEEIGPRMLREYSGIDALGYLREVRAWFKRLRNAEFASAARGILCEELPWEPPDPTCTAQINLSAGQWRKLLGGYFLQSNTRTYNRLMLGLLDESLLPPAVQEIVRRHLEWLLEDPEVSEIVTRIGAKAGSLVPQNVCNWTSYAETRDTGEQMVVTVFLHNVPIELSCGEDLDPADLLVDLLLEPGFADELRDSIPIAGPKPDLIARVETLQRKSKQNGDQLTARIRVRNIGPAAAEGPFEVSLVVSNDNKLNKNDDVLETWVIPFLGAYGSKPLRFLESGLGPLEGKYLFVRVDGKKAVAESNERNNRRPWQTIP